WSGLPAARRCGRPPNKRDQLRRDTRYNTAAGISGAADTRGIDMDAAVKSKQQPLSADEHSHLVRPAEMEWQKTRFPGCEAKPLLFDAKPGLATALMRLAPGAVLPDHEHVQIEQTWVIEGKLVDKEGPAAGLTVGPGEFVWREPGSRHVAWCPDGGLML